MKAQRRVWRSVVLFLFTALIGAQPLKAAGTLDWKSSPNPTVVKVPANQAMNVDLASLLVNVDTTKTLSFALLNTPNSPPSWVSIANNNTNSPTLVSASGHPSLSDVATYQFGMSVSQGGDAGRITEFDLVVVTVPNCGNLAQITAESLEDHAFTTADASTQCSDPAGGTLTYAVDDPNHLVPAWLTLQGAQFSGMAPWTNTHSNVGTYSGFNLLVSTTTGGQTRIPVSIKIDRYFKPPVWTQSLIKLPDVGDNGPMAAQDLSLFVKTYELGETALVYTLAQAPTDKWVTVNSVTGSLSGTPTPHQDDASPLTLVAQISTTDPGGANPTTPITAQAQVQFNVVHVPQTPICAPNPILLPSTNIGANYQQDLSQYCTDPGHDTLTYSFAAGGPSWGTVSALGLMSGVPKFADIGTDQWTLNVTNGTNATSVTVKVPVLKRPVVWTKTSIQLPLGQVGTPVAVDLNTYISNPDQGPLSCQLIGGASDWATVSSGCQFSGTPKTSDLGDQSLQVQVSDGTNKPATTVLITIAPSTIALTPDAKERSAYTNALAPSAPSGQAYQFNRVSGPTWMTVSSAGAIGGTPARTDVGQSPETFVVQATHPTGQVKINVTVSVDKVARPPVCTSPAAGQLAATARVLYTGSITQYAKDQDNENVTFAVKSGPGWLATTAAGALSGTPSDTDQAQSPESFDFTATNTDGLACDITGQITINFNPHPIVPNPNAMVFELNEGASLTANLADPTLPSPTAPYITNPDKDTLTCTASPGNPSFVTLGSNCQLQLNPQHKDVSATPYQYTFTVSGGPFTNIPAVASIKVDSLPSCPGLTSITMGPTPEGTALTPFDSSTKCTDPLGKPLTYAIDDPNGKKPQWLLFSGSTLSGTAPWSPQHSNVGTFNGFNVLITTSTGGALKIPVTVTISRFFKPPVWTKNPIVLPDVSDNGPMAAQDLSAFVKTYETTESPLQYTLTQAPADQWVTVNQGTGSLSGTPTFKDDAKPLILMVQISTTDPGGTNPSAPITAQTQVQFNVVHVPQTPICTNPILLPDANIGVLYQQDLTKFCNDPGGDKLSYSFATGGPSWASVSALGLMSGTAVLASVGANQWTLNVTNGTNSTTVVVKVTVDKRPVQWTTNPIDLPPGKENVAVSADLNGFISNPDQGPITCTLVGTSDWVTIGTDCKVSGTPKLADIGNDTFQVQVTDGISKPVVTTVNITIAPNHPPVWSLNPITLPDAQERTAYSNSSLSTYASDPYPPYATQLTYTKVAGGPSWITVDPKTGAVTGTPTRSDVQASPEHFSVQLSNPSGLTAIVQVTITVDKVPRPPVCTNPAQLTATARQAFTGSVVANAKDQDGETLTFAMKSGPSWLTVASAGSLSGTPTDNDQAQSPENFDITATNTDAMACDITSQIAIQFNPHPISPNAAALSFEVKERATLSANLADPSQPSAANPYISNPDKYTLTCSAITPPSFVSLSSDCKLSLNPQHKDVSDTPYQFHFTVSGGPFTNVPAIAQIKVDRDPRPPVWNPTAFNILAISGQPYQGTLTATDPDGYPLTFSLNGCPAWLKVTNTTGALAGTPQDSDAGTSTCTAVVQNPYLSAPANVTVKVVLLRWTQNPIILPNARALELYPGAGQTVSLAQYVKADPSDTLTFSRVSGSTGAAWANLAPAGTVTGTPATSDASPTPENFQVQVTDANNLTVTTTVQVLVLRPFIAPSWNTNPIPLPDATATEAYGTSVVQYISNPDNLPITCAKAPPAPGQTNGPNWLQVNPDCTLGGTPMTADIGSYTVNLQVSDGEHPPAVVAAFGKVKAPVLPIQIQALNFTVKERATLTVDLKNPQYIIDPNQGAKLGCQFLDQRPAWLTLTPDCVLTLAPKHPDINTYAFNIQANDSLGGTGKGILNITVQRDAQPPQCQNPVNFTAQAGTPFTGTLGNKCVDLDNVALTFSGINLPSWLTMDAAGNLIGTPQEINDGPNTFSAVAKNDVLGTTFTVTVTVQTSLIPPKCDAVVTLPDAIVTKTYLQSIASHCSDPLGGTLTYTKTAGPTWAFFTTSGGVLGTPAQSNLGPGTYTIQVQNAKASTTMTVLITVDPLPAPSWTQDPIPLGEQLVGQLFQLDLNKFVKNPGGGTLTFQKVNGPAWLYLTADGHLSGTPQLADLGQYTAIFSVSNGGAPVQVGAFGTVIKHDPPQWQVTQLEFTIKERQKLDVNINDPQYVKSPSGDALTFSPQAIDTWVTLSSAGDLVATPKHPQVGDHNYTVTVTDAHNLSAPIPLVIHVLADPINPVWSQDPILFTATVGQPFQASLTKYVTDQSGTPLTFAKLWGVLPEWLSVSSSGTLTGTPAAANLGDDSYLMSASNGDGGSANVTVIITVKSVGPVVDPVTVDDSVPWATPQAENLWVLDSSDKCDSDKSKLIKAFEDKMHLYFDALNSAHVQHTGIYVSSNPTEDSGDWNRRITGTPIKGKDGSTLLTWNETNIEADFQERIEGTPSCKCYNSPIWAQFLFYGQLKGLPEYQQTYFLPQVPMDTMIITNKADYYQEYSQGTDQEDWGVEKYLATFTKVHADAKKPYRINVIAPKCMYRARRDSRETDSDGPPFRDMDDDVYHTLTDKTSGTYWTVDCNYKLDTAMQQFADQVKFRALVVSKKEIPLSHTPSDTTQIQVFLGGVQLPPDEWQYNASKNAIDIFWDKIDLTKVKSGEKIEIKYTA